MTARIRFVTGTDTGVGKTVAAAALAVEASVAAERVCYFKPAQTGVRPGEPGDADFVATVSGCRVVEGARFHEPLAPAVAAAVEGAQVDADALQRQAVDLARGCDTLIVEGAGGLLVPLSEAVDMAQFASRLNAELIVATRPTLGTLNHTALTVEAARRRGLDPALVVCNWPPDAGLTETTNLERLKAMAPVMGLIPTVEGLVVESGAAPVTPTILPA